MVCDEENESNFQNGLISRWRPEIDNKTKWIKENSSSLIGAILLYPNGQLAAANEKTIVGK